MELTRLVSRMPLALRLLRVDRGVSQAALAVGISRIVGWQVSQSFVSRIENGSAEFAASEFLCALRVLACSMEEFMLWVEALDGSCQNDEASLLEDVVGTT